MQAPIFALLLISLSYPSLDAYRKKFVYQQIGAVSSHTARQNEKKTPLVPDTPRERILEHYQCMKDVHEILTFYKINYWIDGGTLIGAIRHKGMIPWDDDLDIGIDLQDADRLIALAPLFNKLNYGIHKVIFGFRVSTKTGCGVDILLWKKDNLIYSYDPAIPCIWAYRNNKPIYMTQNELFPLKKYKFGQLTILGPHNPFEYLNSMYGDDWQDVGYKYVSHAITTVKEHIQNHTKEKVVLTKEDKVPAQPTGPLVDRTSAVLLTHQYDAHEQRQ